MDRVLAANAPGIAITSGQSIKQVAENFGPMLRRIARAHEADPGLADELMQETLLALRGRRA